MTGSKLSLCLLPFLFLFSPHVQGNRLTVEKNGKFSSIASAITVAMPNDTVIVQPGRYKEHSLVIDKPLTITGTKQPVIDAEEQAEDIFIIAANEVHISGLARFVNVQPVVSLPQVLFHEPSPSDQDGEDRDSHEDDRCHEHDKKD